MNLTILNNQYKEVYLCQRPLKKRTQVQYKDYKKNKIKSKKNRIKNKINNLQKKNCKKGEKR